MDNSLAPYLKEPQLLILILLAILIGLTLGGKSLVEIIKAIFKKSGDVTVNLKPDQDNHRCPVMAAGGLPVNPEMCVAHSAEHERSIRNEKAILALGSELKDTRKVLFGKLETIEGGVNEVKLAVAGLVVKSNLGPRK